jgi:ribonuclease HI
LAPEPKEKLGERREKFWRMHFDGAQSRSSVDAGIVFTSPQLGDITSYSYRLEFDITDNVVEFEVILLGLEFARDRRIKVLVVVGDSKLVVKQAKTEFFMKNNRLK